MMKAIIKNTPIFYEEHGTGIPLLLLHGWPSDHRHMVADFEPLFQTRPGWRRIYPDMPGFGRTPGADWIANQDHMLEILFEFIQTVAPDQHFVVAGNSYGGYLARGLIYKKAALINGAFLLTTGFTSDPSEMRLPPQQFLVEDPQFLAEMKPDIKPFLNMFVIQTLEILHWLEANSLPGVLVADHSFLERFRENSNFSFPVDQLPEPFLAPTLILAGRQDSAAGYREAWNFLDNFPRATFAVLDRAGHFLFIEQQSLFRSLASEWLNRVEEFIAKTA